MLLTPLAMLSFPSELRRLEIRRLLTSLVLSVLETGGVRAVQHWVCKVAFLWPVLVLMILQSYRRLRTGSGPPPGRQDPREEPGISLPQRKPVIY